MRMVRQHGIVYAHSVPHFIELHAMDQGVNSIGQYATFIDW